MNTTRPTKKPRRTGKRNLQLAGLGCLALLAMVVALLSTIEWYLRQNEKFYFGSPMSLRGVIAVDKDDSLYLRPGSSTEQVVAGRTTKVRVNSLGLRGPEIGPKRVGEKRVLVLGDSMVFGRGVADDETFAARLQEKLSAELGTAVTVGNAGVPGCGTWDLVHAYNRHRENFSPDLVIAAVYIGNDFSDDCVTSREVINGYYFQGSWARSARESWRFRTALRFRLALLAELKIAQFAPSFAIGLGSLEQSPEEIEAHEHFPPRKHRLAGLFADLAKPNALTAKISARVRHNYRMLEDSASVPVIAVIIPTWCHMSEREWSEGLARLELPVSDYRYGASQERLAEVFTQISLPYVDLTPVLVAHSGEESLWLTGDAHFSVAGHRVAADSLLPYVLSILSK